MYGALDITSVVVVVVAAAAAAAATVCNMSTICVHLFYAVLAEHPEEPSQTDLGEVLERRSISSQDNQVEIEQV